MYTTCTHRVHNVARAPRIWKKAIAKAIRSTWALSYPQNFLAHNLSLSQNFWNFASINTQNLATIPKASARRSVLRGPYSEPLDSQSLFVSEFLTRSQNLWHFASIIHAESRHNPQSKSPTTFRFPPLIILPPPPPPPPPPPAAAATSLAQALNAGDSRRDIMEGSGDAGVQSSLASFRDRLGQPHLFSWCTGLGFLSSRR